MIISLIVNNHTLVKIVDRYAGRLSQWGARRSNTGRKRI